MIAICSSSEEIELSGSPKELRDVRQLILNLIQDRERVTCVVETATVNPFPYNLCLSSLRICKSNGFIRVSIFESCLQIEGELDKLEAFAEWFNFDDETLSGYHCHFEYLGSDDLTDVNSNSLVISIKSSTKYSDN